MQLLPNMMQIIPFAKGKKIQRNVKIKLIVRWWQLWFLFPGMKDNGVIGLQET